jgi:hypothetical protein
MGSSQALAAERVEAGGQEESGRGRDQDDIDHVSLRDWFPGRRAAPTRSMKESEPEKATGTRGASCEKPVKIV